jgi:3-carboxy-cis,cis-muconate cycloisomerase
VSAHRLIDSLATTDALTSVFSDASVLQAMLDVEVALARVQARAGVIPSPAADAIAAAARADALDAQAIAGDARQTATMVIPFVAALTDRVRRADPESAAYVHWGVTSQDVADTSMALLLGRARPALAADHARLIAALRRVSDAHAGTIMLGRTLMQPATPITFGLKAAIWHSIVCLAWARLERALDNAAVVQFGGATGTLAPLGEAGGDIAQALARELGLRHALPWHTDRGRTAAVVAASGIYAGGLGKIARDVVLLMQPEIGELSAPGGGSSTMPHKQNPAGCAIVLAAATRLPGLVAASLTGLVHEHERAVGGWQADWPTVAGAIETTGAAVAALAGTVAGLQAHPARMRANLDATKGAVFAERATFLLRPIVGDEAARDIVQRALDGIGERGVAFGDALRADPEAARALPAAVLERIDAPEDYLGSADTFRQDYLAEPRRP